MSTRYFPWKTLPSLFCLIQFPWRLEGYVAFFLAILAGTGISLFPEKGKDACIVVVTIMTVFYTLFIFVNPNYIEHKANVSFSFEGMGWQKEYLTEKAYLHQEELLYQEPKITVIAGDGTLSNYQSDVPELSVEIHKTGKKSYILELPRIYYQGYRVTLQTETTTMDLTYEESDRGLIQVQVPQTGTLEMHYEGTILMKSSWIIACLSFVGFVIFLSWDRIRRVYRNHS